MDKGHFYLGYNSYFFKKKIIRRSFILLPSRQDMFYMLKQYKGAALYLCKLFLRSLSHLESCALLENSCFVQNQFAYLTWMVWGFSVYFGKAGTQPHRSFLTPLCHCLMLAGCTFHCGTASPHRKRTHFTRCQTPHTKQKKNSDGLNCRLTSATILSILISNVQVPGSKNKDYFFFPGGWVGCVAYQPLQSGNGFEPRLPFQAFLVWVVLFRIRVRLLCLHLFWLIN